MFSMAKVYVSSDAGILCNDVPVWLRTNSTFHRIMKSYLSLLFESADNERIMSSHTLLDTKLNQASMPTRVEQMVVIHKESSSWKLFDADAALLLWRLAKQRKGQFNTDEQRKGVV